MLRSMLSRALVALFISVALGGCGGKGGKGIPSAPQTVTETVPNGNRSDFPSPNRPRAPVLPAGGFNTETDPAMLRIKPLYLAGYSRRRKSFLGEMGLDEGELND